MKQLFLLRHAEAVQKDPYSDFTRELTPAGRAQADSLAAYWKSHGYAVDFAMCSAAVRAESTFEPLLPVLGTTDTLVSNNFYNIQEDEMLRRIRECRTNYDRLLYVGHNPGVAFFAMKMAIVPPEAMLTGYSPCSLCVFQIDTDDWSELEWHMGEVTDYWVPPK